MRRLGEDEYGTWLWMPPGTSMQRGMEEPLLSQHPAVKLIAPGQWWTAIWNDGSPYEPYVDISTAAELDGDTVRLIGRDLDVARRRGGGVEIHDEDEFEDRQVLYGDPDHIIDKVRTETARIAAAVEARADPFGGCRRGLARHSA